MGLEEFGDGKNKYRKRRNLTDECKEVSTCPEPIAGEESISEGKKLRRSQWSVVGSSVYLATSLSVKKLPPAVYSFATSNSGVLFVESPTQSDEIISFSDSIFDNVVEEVENFWLLTDEFVKYGFLHKRGYLFYGPAGGGKSCLVQRIVRDVISKDGLAFICSLRPSLVSDALKAFREVEPDRKMVCIFEDIDAIIDAWAESDVLSLLDGENQVDGVINLATTNYPEKLDKRIVGRPRRFDRIIKIDMPNERVREEYLKKKLRFNGADLEKWVKASEGFSFASLADLVISVECFKNSFDESVRILKDLSKKYSSSEFEEANVGF